MDINVHQPTCQQMRAFSVRCTLQPLSSYSCPMPDSAGFQPAIELIRKHARRTHDEPSCLTVLWLGEFSYRNCKLWDYVMLTQDPGCFFIGVRICCHGFVLGVLCIKFGMSLMSRTVRRILIDDPEFIFPPSLQQVTLYRSMQGTSELHSAVAKNKMKVSPKA